VLARARAGDPLRELDQRNPIEYELELHRRRSLPFAPLLFAAVAVPLALASEHRGRSLGLLLALTAAFTYYGLGAFGESVARQGRVPAAVASWLPNGVFAAAGVTLAARSRGRIPR